MYKLKIINKKGYLYNIELKQLQILISFEENEKKRRDYIKKVAIEFNDILKK